MMLRTPTLNSEQILALQQLMRLDHAFAIKTKLKESTGETLLCFELLRVADLAASIAAPFFLAHGIMTRNNQNLIQVPIQEHHHSYFLSLLQMPIQDLISQVFYETDTQAQVLQAIQPHVADLREAFQNSGHVDPDLTNIKVGVNRDWSVN